MFHNHIRRSSAHTTNLDGYVHTSEGGGSLLSNSRDRSVSSWLALAATTGTPSPSLFSSRSSLQKLGTASNEDLEEVFPILSLSCSDF